MRQDESSAAIDSEESTTTEFDRLAAKVRERERNSRLALSRAVDKAVQDLGLDPDKRLSKRHARLIMELMGLELNEYQRSEFDAFMDRSHVFGPEKLKLWIIKNRHFLLYLLSTPFSPVDAERSLLWRRLRGSSSNNRASLHSSPALCRQSRADGRQRRNRASILQGMPRSCPGSPPRPAVLAHITPPSPGPGPLVSTWSW